MYLPDPRPPLDIPLPLCPPLPIIFKTATLFSEPNEFRCLKERLTNMTNHNDLYNHYLLLFADVLGSGPWLEFDNNENNLISTISVC